MTYFPIAEFERLRRLADEAFTAGIPANITETDTEYKISLPMPGVAKDAVSVEAKDGILEISAKRELSVPEGTAVIRSERRSFETSRRFRIPAEVKVEGITAAMTDGIFSITLPKAEKTAPTKIEVRVN